MLLMEDDPDWSFKKNASYFRQQKNNSDKSLKTDPSFVDLLDFLG